MGRVKNNEQFERKDFIAEQVYTNVSPEEELKRLEAEKASAPPQPEAPVPTQETPTPEAVQEPTPEVVEEKIQDTPVETIK